MDRKAILTKTAKGMREASGTAPSLARDLRAVLQAVDGKSTPDELAQRLDQAADPAFEQRIERLAAEGYIREIPVPAKDTGDALDLDFTRAPSRSNPQQESELEARRKAKATVKRWADERAKRRAEERTAREAEEHVKRAAEAAAREAEEQAKRAAEAAAREAVERAKRETAERARREAAELAAREAEKEARRAKEQARQAEEQARRAEEQARRESEIRAAAEAADRTRREAEERARRDAEELARRLAEELSRREAEDKARRAAEEAARQQIEERTRRAAEEAARRAVEEAARREAEERARREAEEATRREAEETARREAEESARRAARESARREAEERQKREAEQRALRQAERQAGREAAQRARRAARERLLSTLRDLLRGGMARFAARAETKARREIPATAEERVRVAAPAERRRPRRRGRAIAFAALASLMGALALLHLMSFDSQAARFEKAAAARFHQPVTIRAVRFSLFLRPHWNLEGVTIGGAGQIRAPRVRLYTAWFGGEPAVEAIEADAPVLSEEGLGWLVLATFHDVSIGRFDARGALLASESLGAPKFDVSAEAGADGSRRNMRVALDGTDIDLTLTPEQETVRFSARSNEFKPPFLAAMPALADFQAEGVVEPEGLRVTRFEGSVGGGTISGSARLNVGERAFEGDVTAKHIDMAKAMRGVFESGMLDGSGTFGLPLGAAGKASSPRLAGNFAVRRGILGGIDMGSMLKDTGRGGSTNFASLEGEVAMADGEVQLRQLRLGAGALSARGNVDMAKDRSLHGRIELDIGTATVRRRGALELSGSFAEPYAQNAVWTRR